MASSNHGAETLRQLRKLLITLRLLIRSSRAELPNGLPAAQLRTTPGIDWWSAAYLVCGLWAVHMLHVARFMLVGWDRISAFPDWQITLPVALRLGFLLIPLAGAAILLLRRWPRPSLYIVVMIGFELSSQTLGRSMFKLVGDGGIWGTVLLGAAIRANYSVRVARALPDSQIEAFRSECIDILRMTVTVCLFVIGTLGLAVTSNLISRYFDEPLGQGTAWVHVGTMLYLSLGMACFLIAPLFRAVVAARSRL